MKKSYPAKSDKAAAAASDGAITQILALLIDLTVLIRDLRDQLEGKRKSHYSVEEVAHLTSRSPYTIRRWLSEGRIIATRIEGTGPRGRLLISRDQVDTLVRQGLASAVPDAVAGE